MVLGLLHFSDLNSLRAVLNHNSLMYQHGDGLDGLLFDDSGESISDDSLLIDIKEKESFFHKTWIIFTRFMVIIACLFYAIANIVSVISFYSILIINLIFFVSSIASYALSPLYHGLSNDWVSYAFSLLQVIAASPIVEFYLLFFIKSIKQTADKIFQIISEIKKIFEGGQQIISLWVNNEKDFEYSAIISAIFPIAYIFYIIIMCTLLYIELFLDKFFILSGAISYLCLSVQILALMMPTYVYYFEILIFGTNGKNELLNIIKSPISDFYDLSFELYKENVKLDAITQTYDRHINEKIFRNLEVLSDSSESPEINKSPLEIKAFRDEIMSYSKQIGSSITSVLLCTEYVPINEYSKLIADDGLHKKSKKILLRLFSILNLAVIAFDIYRYTEYKNSYFLASIIIRILFFPLISYFHLGTVFLYKSKDETIRYSIYVIALFTVLIFLGSIGGFIFSFIYQDTVRIKDLPLPSYYNVSVDDNKYIDSQVCRTSYNGISLIDSIGFALGPYDVTRDKSVFNNQMGYFFGSNWNEFISYEVRYFNRDIPFIIYNDTKHDMTVFGFRGFSSGSELALQIEMFVAQYVIPFFQDMMPFYDFLVDTFIGFYAKFAHNFGTTFFDPKAMITNFVDPLIKICDEINVKDNDRVMFTGINIGGTFAKILGMLYGKQAVSFLSFPVFNDFVTYNYEFEEIDSTFITNIFNIGGLFALPEDGVANNIGIPWIPDTLDTIKSCSNKEMCGLATEKDSVYRSFCTVSNICGKVEQFGNYCESIIGKTYVDLIHRTFLGKV